jgi:hypothetical protein
LTESDSAVPAQAPASGAFEEALSLQRKGNAQAAEERYRAVLSQHRLAKWRSVVDALPRPGVGLMRTRGPSPHDRRSMPLRLLLPLLELRDIQFVALQKELPDAEAALFASTGVPSFLGERLDDFADTAAIIAMLDLVITIDTSIAHVAGALGKPMWVLLPFSADWRWQRDRSDSPWYPTSPARARRLAKRGERGREGLARS